MWLPQFTNGGQFKKMMYWCKLILVIMNWRLLVQKANVAARKAALELEQAKSDLAKSDWEKYMVKKVNHLL